MKLRLMVSPVIVMLSHCTSGQQMSQGVDESAATTTRLSVNGGEVFKQNLMRRIEFEEQAVRQAESAHATNVELGGIYAQLGLLYQDAARWGESEAMLERAVSVLRKTSKPATDLATALGRLATLHILMGKLGECEREDREALRLRQNLGDRFQIARSQVDLAVLYLAKRRYEKARDFARQAEAEFVADGRSDVVDRLTARFTLAEALCFLKACPSAIPLLKAALEEAKTTLRPDDFPVGLSHFLLGYGYWKAGNVSEAGEYMERGTVLMSAQLGWGHPAYLSALKQYAMFLRESRQTEAANVVERRIRQAEAVVDVHSMQTAQGMFGLRGLH